MNPLSQPNLATESSRIIIQTNNSIWPSAIGAFLGAFFAFVFGLIAFYLQKKFERYWKHKNAVVEIEHLLNNHLNQNAGNKYLLRGAISTLQRNHMTYTLLTSLRLPEDINLRIGDIDILNKYQDYEEPTIKVNHGMKAWQGLNEQLQKSIINNLNLPAPIVHKNMEQIQKQAEELLKFAIGLDEDTKYLLSYIRIYMRKDKHIWSIWLLRKIGKSKPIITKKEIERELRVLQAEIDKVSKKSRERIAKISNS